MIRTIISIFIAFFLLLSVGFAETHFVNTTFHTFETLVRTLYDKAESGIATYEDGTAVQTFWEEHKKTLQAWIPHVATQEVDYQLYEAVGFLYVRDYKSAIPKLEVVVGMCENIPHSYTLTLENIF